MQVDISTTRKIGPKSLRAVYSCKEGVDATTITRKHNLDVPHVKYVLDTFASVGLVRRIDRPRAPGECNPGEVPTISYYYPRERRASA